MCEVFERFRTESMNNFGIEPGHFLSLPGMAYQAFLKTTGVELDYITDEEIYTMLKDNLRGGHSFASQRYDESSIYQNMVREEDGSIDIGSDTCKKRSIIDIGKLC